MSVSVSNSIAGARVKKESSGNRKWSITGSAVPGAAALEHCRAG